MTRRSALGLASGLVLAGCSLAYPLKDLRTDGAGGGQSSASGGACIHCNAILASGASFTAAKLCAVSKPPALALRDCVCSSSCAQACSAACSSTQPPVPSCIMCASPFCSGPVAECSKDDGQ